MFKKGDIGGNKVSMCIGRIATVTMLKAGITKEDALCDLSRKFILTRGKYVDKQVHPKTRGGRQKRVD